jgi:Domain of unknown function (DUF1707)
MLRIAAGEGRINLEELDERLSLAYKARTYGQLQALVTDLPGHRFSRPHHVTVPEPETLVLKTTAPIGWAARVSPSSTNTSHISNKAAETADPDASTVILTGPPLSGYIKVRQRRRR